MITYNDACKRFGIQKGEPLSISGIQSLIRNAQMRISTGFCSSAEKQELAKDLDALECLEIIAYSQLNDSEEEYDYDELQRV